jgi:hypothetical protein
MALEVATYIDELVPTNPVAGDPLGQADDHVRLLKSVLQATFPDISGAVNLSDTQLNLLDNKSLAASGYQKLPSGLIVQWGVGTTVDATGSVTFPIAFPTACRSIQITENSAAGWTSINHTVYGVHSRAAAGFSVMSFNWNGTTYVNSAGSFDYIAIGH